MNGPQEASWNATRGLAFGTRSVPATLARLAWFRDWLAACCLAALWLVAAVLLVRRLSGALAQPLGVPLMLSLGALGALTAFGVHLMQPAKRCAAYWLPTMGVLLLSVAISLCGRSVVGFTGIWLLAVAEEVAAWRWLGRRRVQAGEKALSPRRIGAKHGASPLAMPSVALADDVVQQLVRRTTAEGRDVLEGYLRASFQSRQRTAIMHVAFCPPFAHAPKIACRQVDGPATRIKQGAAMPYGVRIECTLVEPTNRAGRVLMEFNAEASCGTG